MNVVPFKSTLAEHNLELVRNDSHTLQINLGFLCNQQCRHCHLNAGPGRRENMDLETVEEVVKYAERNDFETIDITGGAPELNPNLGYLIEKISPYASRTMLRSNLSVMKDKLGDLADLLKSYRVVIVASFPSINVTQTDSQRGEGIFKESIEVLKKLKGLGYGSNDAGLELHLVSNPTGAYLPPTQEQAEKRFHQVLEKKWGVVFNNLYSFANAPLGRFRQWLLKSGNFEKYDCDFNLARGLAMGGQKIHVSEMKGPPQPGSQIVTADHCYTCTAGFGFT
jgi:radical SAM/Cys-rich protein